MKLWYGSVLGSQRDIASIEGDRLRLGRAADNDVVLDSPYVADRAAQLHLEGDAWVLTVLGQNGCTVGNRQRGCGERIRLGCDEPFRIFPFEFFLKEDTRVQTSPVNRIELLDAELSLLVKQMHVELLDKMDINEADESIGITDEYLLTLEKNLDEIARRHDIGNPQRRDLSHHVAGVCVRSEIVERLIQRAGSTAPEAWALHPDFSRLVSAVPHFEGELGRLCDHFFKRLGLVSFSDLSRQMAQLEKRFWQQWEQHAGDLFEEFRTYLALKQLKKQIKDIVFGFGPLEDLLRAPNISEIMVVSSDRIYIEKDGILENSGRRFISDDVTLSIIERIVSTVGRRIDKSKPLVDARLPDGSRVNAVIPPLAVNGPCLTIRKFPTSRLRIPDLVASQSLTETGAEFLRAAVLCRQNILISGGTGTGKTTLLNCLSDFIPTKERLVTIEDTAELQITNDHVVRLETKQANVEGTGAYEIRDLVRNALRMRPDRIVVGECRGSEALDMLQAMNTGHDGSLTTIHANSAADVVLRLEVMVQSAADLPLQSVHRQIASAVDLIVQLARERDGRRRVVQIAQLTGLDEETHQVRMKDLFNVEGDGPLRPTGLIPAFVNDVVLTGTLSLESFYQ